MCDAAEADFNRRWRKLQLPVPAAAGAITADSASGGPAAKSRKPSAHAAEDLPGPSEDPEAPGPKPGRKRKPGSEPAAAAGPASGAGPSLLPEADNRNARKGVKAEVKAEEGPSEKGAARRDRARGAKESLPEPVLELAATGRKGKAGAASRAADEAPEQASPRGFPRGPKGDRPAARRQDAAEGEPAGSSGQKGESVVQFKTC